MLIIEFAHMNCGFRQLIQHLSFDIITTPATLALFINHVYYVILCYTMLYHTIPYHTIQMMYICVGRPRK